VERSVIVGAVYTPFIRMAMRAKAAWQQGRELSVDEVPADDREPTAVIALRWYTRGVCDDAMPYVVLHPDSGPAVGRGGKEPRVCPITLPACGESVKG
jgi:hypothetical protein